jgi:hypothetical protein
LDELPIINKAFEKGEVSYSKVRAMTRVATNENEDYLMVIAQHGTASHIEKLVRKYERVEKSINKEPLEDEQDKREFTSFQDSDGMWLIRGRLPREEGALVIKVIDEIMNKQNKPMNKIRGYSDLNVSAETETPEPEIMERSNFPQKRADALCALAENYLAGDKNGDLKTLAGHERCQVVLHLDVETLKHDHCGAGECNCDHDYDLAESCQHLGPLHNPPHLDEQWISMENAKRLSCDASLLTVLEDKDGNVLNIGRNSRAVPPMLKRALDIRDETCQFPGCCESHYVDFHHIKHWANGGETSKGNLIKLCRFHHRALHNSQYNIETQGDKNNPDFIFKTIEGRVMERSPQLPQTAKTTVEGTEKDFTQQWPDIDVHTCKSQWQGDSMDYGMAIDSLLYRRKEVAADLL